ncbi:MAG TPA: CHAT domain-containing tetratricopeptide repeat protein [Bacteroidales bacterium]|nr:CHAT domain-containing tetratricopeptide repeat protein [Bacteroidales bacterium]
MELECAYYLSRIALSAGKYDEVHKYTKQADHINNTFKLNLSQWFECQYFCGSALLKESKFDEAYKLFNALEPELVRYNVSDSTVARFYSKKGASCYYKGDINKASDAYANAVKFGKKGFGENAVFVSDQVNNLGVMNFMLNRNDEALSYYLQAERLQNALKNPDDLAKADIYTNIGLIFKVKKDFDNAIKFFEKARDLYLKNTEKEAATVAHAYLNLAGTYQQMGQYNKQLLNIMKSKEYSEKYFPELLPKIYFQLAYYYECVKNLPMGYQTFKLALQKAKTLFGESADLAYAYNNLGEFCLSNNYHFSEALPYINYALAYFSKTRGAKNTGITRNYLSLGEYFDRSGNPERALAYYHKAILACVEDFSNEDIYSLPYHTNSLSDEHLIEALKAKASILQWLAEKTSYKKLKFTYLEASFRHYMHVLRMFDKIRSGFISESSGFLLSSQENYIYNDALQLVNRLYSFTGNRYYAEKAFLIADKAHAAHLQIMMQKKEFPEKFEFSDTLFTAEYKLKKELNTLNELILREKSSKWRDSAKIVFWNEQVTAITARIHQVQSQIIRRHPAYQHLMSGGADEKLVSNLRSKLKNNEAVIEYYWSDSLLYSFCMLKNNLWINQQVVDASFYKDIQHVLFFLNSPKYARNDSLVTLNYRTAAYNLYLQLLAPFESQIKGKKLILIPDGQLSYMPFGVLLTSSTQGKCLNFKELPYLIKQHPVQYLYASRFLQDDFHVTRDAKILAFAPDYSVGKSDKNDLLNGIAPLDYNVKEVQSIVQSGSDKVYLSTKASEANFKKEANRYSLVHLAMHAIIDDEDPGNSRLVFTPSAGSNEDNLLYSYETYNMELNIDLLVLSACKTGTGKLQKGEGMLSLTRGFIFAGVKSIITSLWTVNDKSGASFFSSFYKNLASQQSKSVALQKASMDYIQSADNIGAHPYYWAGFILIGNDESVQFASSPLNIWIIVAACIVILALAWYIVRVKCRKD